LYWLTHKALVVREVEKEETMWQKKARRHNRAAEKREAVAQQKKEEKEAGGNQGKESEHQAEVSQSTPKRIFV